MYTIVTKYDCYSLTMKLYIAMHVLIDHKRVQRSIITSLVSPSESLIVFHVWN